jgi:hypothetical protein
MIPIVGEAMVVVLSDVPVSINRGGRKPFLQDEISSFVDASGLEVPAPHLRICNAG